VNLGQLLTNAARRAPQAPAVTQGDRRLTYAELDARVDALAHGLAALGLAAGDRVAVLMHNCPELLETMFACFKAGYCWVPLNSRFTSAEVEFQVVDAGAAALVCGAGLGEVVDGASLPGVHLVGTGAELPAGGLAYEQVLDTGRGRGSAVVSVDRDALAWLFYTSGTTGRPKGAMLTHGVLAFVTASWLADLTPMDEQDVTLHAAPLTHGAGFHALATTARVGHHVLTDPGRFEPEAVFAQLQRERVTNTWLVPTQIIMLVDAAADSPPALPYLRHVVYGGAPFPPAELRRALETLGPCLVQLYGQGETPMTATVLPPAAHAAAVADPSSTRLASAGFARPGMDVRVFDADDVELPAGEVGEVVVRGPAVMLGYWGREDATREALRGGWLHTGDLGRMDEQGYLYLLDRAKDLIITGGSNVYAVEVEAALVSHDAVRDVAVIGVPDRTWGEVVVAVVVSDVPPAEAEARLVEHAALSLAPYKRPRTYRFVEALPRNPTGKVLKRELREQLTDVQRGSRTP
jgi:acyl-CoA synthetase (AMP-forming)/AMP-acid ligase II